MLPAFSLGVVDSAPQQFASLYDTVMIDVDDESDPVVSPRVWQCITRHQTIERGGVSAELLRAAVHACR